MGRLTRIMKMSNPRLFDIIIGEIQDGLGANIAWLDHVFGRVERLVEMIDGKKYFTPNIYLGRNDYELILPDQKLGNFCFFQLEEPQQISYERGDTNKLTAPFSIVVWVDMRTIEDSDTRNTEAVKRDILRVLNGEIFVRSGWFRINRIYDKAENVFSGYTLDEVDNQFLMQPFCGWKFTGELHISDTCL